MRLKYYLRGAGVGILITTAIFTIILLFNNYGRVSDEEVITRAKAMGYVLADDKKTIVYTSDTSVISSENKEDDKNKVDNKEQENQPVVTEPAVKPDETKTEEKKTEETKPVETKTEDKKTTESKTEEKKPTETKSDIVTSANPSTATPTKPGSTTSVTYMPFSINKGEDSEDVCKRLADLGMVSDAKAFNRKLVEDGVDSKIVVGTFYINTGMTEAQLEDVLSSSKNRKTRLN